MGEQAPARSDDPGELPRPPRQPHPARAGEKRVEEIRPRLVGAFLRHLQDDKGLSAATARKAQTVLSAVLSYAVAMEYVESNAAMKVPPPETHAAERVAPTLEETARILLEAEATDREFLTYLWVAAETGGRRGETLALRWGGVDFDAGGLDRRHGLDWR